MGGFSRKLKNINLGIIGLVICLIGVLLTISEFAAELFMTGDQVRMDAINFVYLIINVLFYFYVGKMFLEASKTHDFAYARYGICVFVITEYVMPFIRMLLFNGFIGFYFYLPYLMLPGILFGILYFVMLILEYRDTTKNYYVPMLIFGSLVLVENIVLSYFLVSSGVNGLIARSSAYNITYAVSQIVEAFSNVLLGILFFLYPLYSLLRRKGKM